MGRHICGNHQESKENQESFEAANNLGFLLDAMAAPSFLIHQKLPDSPWQGGGALAYSFSGMS